MLENDISYFLREASRHVNSQASKKYSFFVKDIERGAEPIELVIETSNNELTDIVVGVLLSESMIVHDIYREENGSIHIEKYGMLVPYSSICTMDFAFNE